MRVIPLASGSQGNSTFVEGGGTRMLIDAGLACVELERRLEAVGVAPKSIDAIYITHRHKDHIRGATKFGIRYKTRIYGTRRTVRLVGSECHKRIRRVEPGQSFEVGDLACRAIPVAHDAPDTTALLVEHEGVRYGHATDLGVVDTPILEIMQDCTGLYLEFNHDLDMLMDGPYPAHLKRRVAGDEGHLSNAQARDLLCQLNHSGLKQVWLAHLSAKNNTHELALAAAGEVVGDAVALSVAVQAEPSLEVVLSV